MRHQQPAASLPRGARGLDSGLALPLHFVKKVCQYPVVHRMKVPGVEGRIRVGPFEAFWIEGGAERECCPPRLPRSESSFESRRRWASRRWSALSSAASSSSADRPQSGRGATRSEILPAALVSQVACHDSTRGLRPRRPHKRSRSAAHR
eukprot:scaffold1467_cov264-Pinguiococcus_pyrenoidosus.AAC.18